MNTDSLLARQLDEYRLEALLGRGGMARVYRAVDVRLRRYAAVKVIDTQFRADAAYIQRFESEAQAIARLDHPHIVKIYRFGESAGCLYIAMQYLAGADLGQLLDGYRRSGEWIEPAEAARLIRQVGGALDYAHRQGVIHRDIKPSNIMVDEQGRAIVTDFGLALLPDLAGAEVFGSPHYMAPEQVVASGQVVPQSDLYSLGVVAYEMFTGRLPFLAADPADVAAMQVQQAPPPPRQVRPALTPEVEAVILKCLAKEPSQRYASGLALADALDAALTTTVPPTLSHLSLPERAKLQAAQTRLPPLTPMVVGATETLAVATGPLPAAGSAPRSSPARSRARLWIAAAVALIGVLLCGAWLTNWGFSQLAGRATATASQTTASQPTTSQPTEAPATDTPQVEQSATATANPINLPSLVFTRGDGSNYLVIANHSGQPISLEDLTVGDGKDAISGTEWDLDILKNGACVIAWKDAKTAERTTGAEVACAVGEQVIRSGGARFWKDGFNIYFDGELVSRCVKDEATCTVELPPAP